jgi:hypothetical protein
MKAEEFSKNILSIDPDIRFAGIMDKSGYLYAGGIREGLEGYLHGKNNETSFAQSAYIVGLRKIFSSELGNLRYIVYNYDKVKLFSLPVGENILVFSTTTSVDTEKLLYSVTEYVKSVYDKLTLYPPANIINNEKKEVLKNLHESGIAEEMIAEQLDLNLNTVRTLIQELRI